MLHSSKPLISGLAAVLLMFSMACKKSIDTSTDEKVSSEVLQKIYDMGFNISGVKKVPEGYVVEGDILLKPEQLGVNSHSPWIRMGETEQYRTNNTVSAVASSPRTITLSITGLGSDYTTALDNAIARYNALGLRLIFQRVSGSADISVVSAGLGGALGRSGFPSGGNPYNTLQLDPAAIGGFPDINNLTTIIAHELGHCIGFRHTDYMNRSYSGCLVDASHPNNEGAGSDGAILIFATPSSPDPDSWMLACVGPFDNRPFTYRDIVALRYLYGIPSPSCGDDSQRLINGVCQTSGRYIISTEYDDFHDRCMISYYYMWSNGEVSSAHTTREPGQCP
jgi:hypothetical protein